MLHKILQAKQEEIQKLKNLAEQGLLPDPEQTRSRPGLQRAIWASGPGAVIAEYKRASPSRGEINPDLGPGDAAQAFVQGGAAAVSVLTMPQFFQGELGFLQQISPCGLPLLHKDFILHPLQVRQTAHTPASALLLIARLFLQQPERLHELYTLALELGLEPVLEIFQPQELNLARELGTGLIQVNTRDLDTLQLDFGPAREIIQEKKAGETWILASGIQNREQVRDWSQAGFDAFLVGTWIMSGNDPAEALKGLTM
ncbi:MAG: indole-3-glycerol-phosphate synthase [Desulfohalobiaceae bacterium]